MVNIGLGLLALVIIVVMFWAILRASKKSDTFTYKREYKNWLLTITTDTALTTPQLDEVFEDIIWSLEDANDTGKEVYWTSDAIINLEIEALDELLGVTSAQVAAEIEALDSLIEGDTYESEDSAFDAPAEEIEYEFSPADAQASIQVEEQFLAQSRAGTARTDSTEDRGELRTDQSKNTQPVTETATAPFVYTSEPVVEEETRRRFEPVFTPDPGPYVIETRHESSSHSYSSHSNHDSGSSHSSYSNSSHSSSSDSSSSYDSGSSSSDSGSSSSD